MRDQNQVSLLDSRCPLRHPSLNLTHPSSITLFSQVLFYRLMSDHLKELLGILYTPGAAEVILCPDTQMTACSYERI